MIRVEAENIMDLKHKLYGVFKCPSEGRVKRVNNGYVVTLPAKAKGEKILIKFKGDEDSR